MFYFCYKRHKFWNDCFIIMLKVLRDPDKYGLFSFLFLGFHLFLSAAQIFFLYIPVKFPPPRSHLIPASKSKMNFTASMFYIHIMHLICWKSSLWSIISATVWQTNGHTIVQDKDSTSIQSSIFFGSWFGWSPSWLSWGKRWVHPGIVTVYLRGKHRETNTHSLIHVFGQLTSHAPLLNPEGN